MDVKCNVVMPPLSYERTSELVTCASASVDNDTCVKLHFVSLFETFQTIAPSQFALNERTHSESYGNCTTTVSVNVSSGRLLDSGWFVCRTVAGRLPWARPLALFIPGRPRLIDCQRRSAAGGALLLGCLVVAYPTANISLWYRETNLAVEAYVLYFKIEPKPTDKLLSFERRDELSIRDWSVSEVSVRLANPAQHCELVGIYFVLACNDEGCDRHVLRNDKCTPAVQPRGDRQRVASDPFGICDDGVLERVQPVGFRNLSISEARDFENTSDAIKSFAAAPPPRLHSAPLTQTPPTSWTLPGEGMAAALLPPALLVVVACAALLVVGGRKRRRANGERDGGTAEETIALTVMRDGAVENASYMKWMGMVRERQGFEVAKIDDLEIVGDLGEGEFGRVQLVQFSDGVAAQTDEAGERRKMAMKQVKYVSADRLSDLEREASILAKLDHPNVVKFYGLSYCDSGFALLFEYMERGDLVQVLRSRNADLNRSSKPFELVEQLRMGCDVANGLEYLANLHLVHRDVAARNCLVNQALVVKLSDFGLSRDVYSTDYYRMDVHTMVPIRWLPPECILYRKFTTHSDMWSFGVLMWEIFAGGQIPWFAFSNAEVLDIVRRGDRLERPRDCPEEIFERLLLACWRANAAERLSPTAAKTILEQLMDCHYCSLTDRSPTDSNYSDGNELLDKLR